MKKVVKVQTVHFNSWVIFGRRLLWPRSNVLQTRFSKTNICDDFLKLCCAFLHFWIPICFRESHYYYSMRKIFSFFEGICFRESNYYYSMRKISSFIWYATILYAYFTHRMFLQKLFYPIRKSYDVIHSIYVYCPGRCSTQFESLSAHKAKFKSHFRISRIQG